MLCIIVWMRPVFDGKVAGNAERAEISARKSAVLSFFFHRNGRWGRQGLTDVCEAGMMVLSPVVG